MGGSNGPWRGHFGSGFEGGMRTPAIVRWPGKVKAGTVTDEMFSAVDWLPTLAALAGEKRRGARRSSDRRSRRLAVPARTAVPRPGRDHVIYYGSDAAVMSVKWKTMKVVFRYTESASGPIVKPQWPLIFDLIDDPNEEWDLMAKRLDCIWVMAPVAQRLSALQQSAAQYHTSSRGRSSPATSDLNGSERVDGTSRILAVTLAMLLCIATCDVSASSETLVRLPVVDGRDVHFIRFSIDEAPRSRIRAITQDDYGFLWLGTTTGLYRYDGYRLEHYLPRAGRSGQP